MKFLFICLSICLSILADDNIVKPNPTVEKNIWLKTYKNYKNYNILINNITLIEQKLKKSNTDENQDLLNQKLTIYKSKLELYEINQNFNTILKQYKYTSPTIIFECFIFLYYFINIMYGCF